MEVVQEKILKGIKFQVLSNNLDSEDPEYTWRIKMDNKTIDWKTCEDNNGDFVYENVDDAFKAAEEYLIEHSNNDRKETINDLDLERQLYLNEMENPEDNMEEIPEDFRMNKVNK